MEVSKKILVTGGTGFLGMALIPRLEGKIRVLDRNEEKLVMLKEKYKDIEMVVGDITNEWVVKKAMQGIDEVYHLAAVKHIGLAETNVYECVNSNVIGSLNILAESLNTKPRMIIGISTDKAAQVRGIYGATKLIMEGLFREAESANPDTEYRIVRYGNVLGSSGSVLPKWKEAIQNREPITITNPESTRFYWTVEQAIDHIFDCLSESTDSIPYIPRMKSIRLGDLAEATLKKYGKTKVIQTQLDGCDNLHETMCGKIFSNEVEKFSIDEITELI
jgi:UDP-N-acetylglucosamine 4,6-dehydratase/UDP-glucose 4-epimerase